MHKKSTIFSILTIALGWSFNAMSSQPLAPGGIPPRATKALPRAYVPVRDPLSGFNRAMYTFNDGLDHLILRPISRTYLDVAPAPLVSGVSNFYNNLDTLPTMGNDLLQANIHQFTTDTSRFLINTTLGIGGIFDVAKLGGIPQNSEDMGLTFARWGWTSSTYVVLPFFGPSTVRDALGRPIDNYMSVYPYIRNVSVRNQLYALGIVNTRANLLQLDSIISEAALDPYVFQRNAYLQHRAYLIERNKDLDDAHYVTAKKQKLAGIMPDEVPPMTAKQVASY